MEKYLRSKFEDMSEDELESAIAELVSLKENKFAAPASISEFMNGKLSIQCQRKEEAIELFKWLRSKNIIWKSGKPLINTLWVEHKDTTLYSHDKGKGLSFWHTGRLDVGRVVQYSEIANDLTYTKEEVKEISDIWSVDYNYAIVCKTNEEACNLFRWLIAERAYDGNGQPLNSRNINNWVRYGETPSERRAIMLYSHQNNQRRIYQGDTEEMEELGYKVIAANELLSKLCGGIMK